MEIGEVFEFDSNGTIRKAIFKEEKNGKVKAVMFDSRTTAGTKVLIEKKLIIKK